MKKIALFIAAGSGMGADAAKHLAANNFKIAILSSSGKGEELAISGKKPEQLFADRRLVHMLSECFLRDGFLPKLSRYSQKD